MKSITYLLAYKVIKFENNSGVVLGRGGGGGAYQELLTTEVSAIILKTEKINDDGDVIQSNQKIWNLDQSAADHMFNVEQSYRECTMLVKSIKKKVPSCN